MARSQLVRISWILPLLATSACVAVGSRSPAESELAEPEAGRTLTSIVAELHVHLAEDTYRLHRTRAEGGQNVFSLALWRLERLRDDRARPVERWENVDIVIEYARGKALERLRRYGEASEAYGRVSAFGSRLETQAAASRMVMEEFAQHSGPLVPTPSNDSEALEAIEDRIRTWGTLALEYADTPFESLALEEAEAWEMVRVDWFVRHRGAVEAIPACRRLVERHHASKLQPRNLIRLGDLYAEAARDVFRSARAHLAPFDAHRYEGFLDQAFAAYELAGEYRTGTAGEEAESKIEALLAQHEGVRAHVP